MRQARKLNPTAVHVQLGHTGVKAQRAPTRAEQVQEERADAAVHVQHQVGGLWQRRKAAKLAIIFPSQAQAGMMNSWRVHATRSVRSGGAQQPWPKWPKLETFGGMHVPRPTFCSV